VIVLLLILAGTFYVLSIVDSEDSTYWRVFTGVLAFCIIETIAVALF
jgi:hypothetical protein